MWKRRKLDDGPQLENDKKNMETKKVYRQVETTTRNDQTNKAKFVVVEKQQVVKQNINPRELSNT